MRKNLKFKTKKPKNRRKRKRVLNVTKYLRFLGVNAAGLRSKLLTFKKVLNDLKPSVFFIEETKLKKEGSFKLANYDIFELVRKNKNGGGGLALGCDKNFNLSGFEREMIMLKLSPLK